MIRMRWSNWLNCGVMWLVCLSLAACVSPAVNHRTAKSNHISSTEIVLDWATQTTIALYRYEPNTYVKTMVNNAHYFTPKGFLTYQHALQHADLIKQITKQRVSSSAQMITAPSLLAHGKDNAYYTWVVRVPVLLVTQRGKILKTKNLHVVLRIVQAHAFVGGSEGLRIEHFLAKPYTEFKK